ncbi:phenylacetate--CoA ligase family protein [Legionella cardiaca]|uniref:Uncharacterized protein n=1 Tax=Legionella cardiaca TaxID=1071983 RepID=A0ABY8AN10_9GAMM|nr:hypothetical protein [Legionella cardiaca]WED42032.1 hypothetical protein PXX05_08810 [Legionella cardiaca]
MPVYQVNSPVIIFNHPEYGERLLFKQGLTNPRNELGKNGVSLHSGLGSLFYRTIKIRATLINEKGQHENREFSLNRNSLIKYLGENASTNDSDDILIQKLNQGLLTSDLNNSNQEDKQKQSIAGERLRHAGQHNRRLISHWTNAFIDYLKGSFLGWLYQKTIGGLNRIKIRFLFVRKEKDIFEAGEVLAKKRFHDAYKDVPAYKQHIIRFNGIPVSTTTFQDIPLTTKENYIKYQQFDSDTHFYGKYPAYAKTDTSTGTTGKPTAWVRGDWELEIVKKSLQLAAKIQFGNRQLSYINAFALGPWATGLTTYELMRNTGSVFATGPDKEKILDEILRIAKYEEHQLNLAVDKLLSQNPRILPANKQLISDCINNTLKALLADRELTVASALNKQMELLPQQVHSFILKHKTQISSIVQTLNTEKKQTIIAGYPPFLLDLATYIKEKGHDLKDFSIVGIVGGQAISEAMRDRLVEDGFSSIYSSYGASDLDINLGVEAEDEIFVRKAIEQNPGLAREFYGANKGLPMVFHYDPMNCHVECLDGKDEKDEERNSLVFTTTREDRSSPRIRYNLGDKGRVYASSDVQALLAKYGIFYKPKTNLPLMFVWGRDSTVVYNGANLAFTELERAITDTDTENKILKKAFYSYQDHLGAEKLEIWLELNEGIELTNDLREYAQTLMSRLALLNQDFRYQLESLNEGTPLPTVRFFKRSQSPIGEAGGHRKQVLVFQKENLPNGYQLPKEDQCQEVTVPMSQDILNFGARAQL